MAKNNVRICYFCKGFTHKDLLKRVLTFIWPMLYVLHVITIVLKIILPLNLLIAEKDILSMGSIL